MILLSSRLEICTEQVDHWARARMYVCWQASHRKMEKANTFKELTIVVALITLSALRNGNPFLRERPVGDRENMLEI